MNNVHFVYSVTEDTILNGYIVIHRKFVAECGEVAAYGLLYARIRRLVTGECVDVHRRHIANTENDAIEMAKQKNKEIMDNLKIELSKCLSKINWLSKELSDET